MYYYLLTHFVGALVFLFIVWKKIREDYPSQVVFSFSFLVLFGITCGALISSFLFSKWWFWVCFLGIVLAVIFSVFKFKMKIFEVIDALVAGLMPWIALLFLADSTIRRDIFSLGGFFILLAVYILYRFVDTRYKRFSWYRSGRVGFSSLFALGMLFVLRAFAGLVSADMLSFVGKEDVFISGVFSFVTFLGIFHLARRI